MSTMPAVVAPAMMAVRFELDLEGTEEDSEVGKAEVNCRRI
jgi:hypothetical protein